MPPAREPNETTLEYRKLQTGGSTFIVSFQTLDEDTT